MLKAPIMMISQQRGEMAMSLWQLHTISRDQAYIGPFSIGSLQLLLKIGHIQVLVAVPEPQIIAVGTSSPCPRELCTSWPCTIEFRQ